MAKANVNAEKKAANSQKLKYSALAATKGATNSAIRKAANSAKTRSMEDWMEASVRSHGIRTRKSDFSSSGKSSSSSGKSSLSKSSGSSSSKKSSSWAYKPPTYDEAKYSRGIDTSFYTNASNRFATQANRQRAMQIGEAQKQQQAALRQAYINRAQNQMALNNNLAMAGIRGGATETSNLKLANVYGQAVGAANSDYANSVNAINQNIDQSIFDYQQDMAARAEEYRQNQANARWQAAREDYANKYKARQENEEKKYNRRQAEEEKKYTRKQAEKQAETEYSFNYYNNLYSGYSKKKVKSIIKDLDKKIKKAKGKEKIRLQQRRAAAGARLGVIKNK